MRLKFAFCGQWKWGADAGILALCLSLMISALVRAEISPEQKAKLGHEAKDAGIKEATKLSE